MCLFADDTAVYLAVGGSDNERALQTDLDRLSVWEDQWDMEFNPSKVVRVTTSKKIINSVYTLHGQILEAVTSARYLGVDISSGLSWNSHIDRITENANPKVRETAYNTHVRPQLEYSSPIWHPDTDDKTLQLQKIQRRAARWTTSNYNNRSSVSAMLDQLGWRSMDLWQYLFQTISNPHIECSGTVTQ